MEKVCTYIYSYLLNIVSRCTRYGFLCRYVTVAFDEMKIREDAVFNKCTGEIIGFVNFGEQSLDKRFQELRK